MQFSCLITATLAADITLSIEDELTKQVGEQAVIKCEVTLDEFPDDVDKNIWSTDVADKKLRTSSQKIAKEKKIVSKLYLKNLSMADKGTYTCASGDLSKSISLKVEDKITFTDSPNGANIERAIVLGKDNEVICQASPDGLNYAWTLPNDTIVYGKSLDVSSFTQADEGDYICDVDNTDSNAVNLPSDASDQATYTISIAYPPKVSVSPKELVVTAGEGQNTLTCTSDAKPVGDYQWTKDGVDIDGATNATFLVDKIEYSNGGKITYACKSSNEHGSATDDVSVRIIKLPTATITEFVEGEKYSRTEPESLTLTCNGDGDPVPDRFVWTLPDGSTQETATLSIDAVDETHHGMFQCDATSTYNEKQYGPATATIDVDVKYKPRFKGDETVYVIPGNDLDVKCTFKANPKPTVSWADESLDATSTDVDDFQTSSTIKLKNVTQYINYTCSATNDIDSAEQVINLVEATVPEKPTGFTAVNIQYQNVTLKWTKPVSKGIPITSYLIKYNQQGKQEKFETTISPEEGQTEPATEIQITNNLLSGQSYDFTITAQNGAGLSVESDILAVDMKAPEKPVLEIQTNSTDQIKWVVTTRGAETLKKLVVKYGKYGKNGNRVGDTMTKEIDVSAGNMDSDKLPIQSMSLEGGVKYWVELTVINDQGMESEKQTTDFTMPDDIKKGSAGTVISVMVGIIFILILFVDISCYYMKQGGFIMTIQRAMCSSGDDKEEIEKGEKVPLNQDGSESEKDKNRDTDE